MVRLVGRHPFASFVVMSTAMYTAVVLVPFLDHEIAWEMPVFDAVGHFLGSALPGFLVVAAMRGRAGVRDLASRCLRWRVPLRWYAIALLGVPAAFMLLALTYGTPVFRLLGDEWPRVFTAVLPRFALAILWFNVAEEIGWTGFFNAELQERMSPVRACALTAVPFAVLHLPGFFDEEGWVVANVGPALGFLVFETVVLFFARLNMMWLYNRSGASVLIAGLFHASFNTTVSRLGHEFLPDPDEGFWIATVIVVVAGGLILFRTRRHVGRAHSHG